MYFSTKSNTRMVNFRLRSVLVINLCTTRVNAVLKLACFWTVCRFEFGERKSSILFLLIMFLVFPCLLLHPVSLIIVRIQFIIFRGSPIPLSGVRMRFNSIELELLKYRKKNWWKTQKVYRKHDFCLNYSTIICINLRILIKIHRTNDEPTYFTRQFMYPLN